jgi:hypothetical protein
MEQSVHQPAADDATTADARPDRHVGEGVEAWRRAPAPLGQRRGVDVGVEADRHGAERGANRPDHIRVDPLRFRRRCDAATLEVDRSERRDADGGELRRALAEAVDDACERLRGSGGRDHRPRAQVERAAADGADERRSSGLHASVD